MIERVFPVLWQCSREETEELKRLGCPRFVPWPLVAPHEAQAKWNHDQTLQRLSERGGLSPAELVAILEGKTLREIRGLTDPAAVPRLLELIAAYRVKQ